MTFPRRSRIANAYGPLERENYELLRQFPEGEAYRLLREYPVGVTYVNLADIRCLFGNDHKKSTLQLISWHLEVMQRAGMIQLDYALREGDRLDFAYIATNDIVGLPIPDWATKQPSKKELVDAFSQASDQFAIEYRKATESEWQRTGRDAGQLKYILKSCGGAKRVIQLIYDYFHMPLEAQVADEISFPNFIYTVPKLYRQMLDEEHWDDAKAEGEKAAAARAKDVAYGSPEWIAQTARIDAEMEAGRELREAGMRAKAARADREAS